MSIRRKFLKTVSVITAAAITVTMFTIPSFASTTTGDAIGNIFGSLSQFGVVAETWVGNSHTETNFAVNHFDTNGQMFGMTGNVVPKGIARTLTLSATTTETTEDGEAGTFEHWFGIYKVTKVDGEYAYELIDTVKLEVKTDETIKGVYDVPADNQNDTIAVYSIEKDEDGNWARTGDGQSFAPGSASNGIFDSYIGEIVNWNGEKLESSCFQNLSINLPSTVINTGAGFIENGTITAGTNGINPGDMNIWRYYPETGSFDKIASSSANIKIYTNDMTGYSGVNVSGLLGQAASASATLAGITESGNDVVVLNYMSDNINTGEVASAISANVANSDSRKVVLINVTVTGDITNAISLSGTGVGNYDPDKGGRVIWNFIGAAGKTITLGDSYVGITLAPGATVTNYSTFLGAVYADKFIAQNGEIHRATYQSGGRHAAEFEFENPPIETKINLIKVYKTDDEADDEISEEDLAATTFTLFTDDGCTAPLDGCADKAVELTDDGYVVTFDIIALEETTDYYLKETGDTSYDDSETVFVCTVDPDGTVTYSVKGEADNGDSIDEETGFPLCNNLNVTVYNIEFEKFDNSTIDKIALEGAVFGIYTDEACETPVMTGGNPYTVSSDDQGVVSFNGLKAGTYFLKETTPPEGYEPNESVYTATIVIDDGEASVTFGVVGGESDLDVLSVPNDPIVPEIEADAIQLIKMYILDGQPTVPDAADLEATAFTLYEDEECLTPVNTAYPVYTDGAYVVTFDGITAPASGATEDYYLKETGDTSFDESTTLFKCLVDDEGGVEYSIVGEATNNDSIDEQSGFPICRNVKNTPAPATAAVKLIKVYKNDGGEETPSADDLAATVFTLYGNAALTEVIATGSPVQSGFGYVVSFTVDVPVETTSYYLKETGDTSYDESKTVFECMIDNAGNVSYSIVGTADNGDATGEGFPICNNVKVTENPIVPGETTTTTAESPIVPGETTTTTAESPIVPGETTTTTAESPIVPGETTTTTAESPVVPNETTTTTTAAVATTLAPSETTSSPIEYITTITTITTVPAQNPSDTTAPSSTQPSDETLEDPEEVTIEDEETPTATLEIVDEDSALAGNAATGDITTTLLYSIIGAAALTICASSEITGIISRKRKNSK